METVELIKMRKHKNTYLVQMFGVCFTICKQFFLSLTRLALLKSFQQAFERRVEKMSVVGMIRILPANT